MRSLIISAALILSLFAQSSIDTIYTNLYKFIDSSVTSLDNWLASDANQTLKEPFHIRLYIDSINEEYQNSSFNFGIKAYIALPKAKQRLNLFIEDFRKSDDIDSNQKKNIPDSIEKNDYQVGLQYLTKGFLHYRAGVKVRSFTPDPFVGLYAQRTFHLQNSWFYVGARSIFFVKKHLDHRIFANYNYKLSDQALFTIANSLRYEQETTNHYQQNHSLTLYYSLSKYKIFSATLNGYLAADKIDKMSLRYYYTGIDYTDRIFRPWIFYRLSPGIIFRKERDFDPALRLMVRFGVIFESY